MYFEAVNLLARLMGKFQDRGLTPWENLLTEARVGIAYFELEDWQHAEATLQRAVSLGTKNPKVFEYLKAFSKSGEP